LERSITVLVQFLGRSTQGGGDLLEEMEVPAGAAVGQVVALFGQKHGQTIGPPAEGSAVGNIEEGYLVMLNGRSLERGKPMTFPVQNGDRITIFLPLGGG
jgi:sulfur carrier protein ThiS